MLLQMRMVAAATLAASLTAVARGQEACVLHVEGAAGGVRVLGHAAFDRTDHGVLAELPAGVWRLRFPPFGGGRPAPLDVAAPAGGTVAVRVASPAPAGGPRRELAQVIESARTFELDGSDQRVLARVRRDMAGPTGLVCRWLDADNHYRLLLDAARGEVRLERCLGGSTLLLGRRDLAHGTRTAEWHDLELEVEGFRLLALCDDEPVARALDGALARGAVGTWAAPGTSPRFERLTAAAPAPALATLAVAAASRQATVTAAAPGSGNGVFALCLRLDRPTALWPVDGSGFEPFVLQRPAEPVFLAFACGAVAADGALAGTLGWPDAAALRGQAAMVGGWLGSPDAQALRARLPWATLRL
jgi:hypothetical protein